MKLPQMPKMGMGSLLFGIVLIIALVIAMQKKMSHKLFFYHHSQTSTEDDDIAKATGNVEPSNKEKLIKYGSLDEQTGPITLSEEDAFVRCHVPSLNTQQCWESRFFQCPVINGSYAQCTNNNLPLPKYGNAPCETGRAGFEMAPPKYKLSENCYYQKTGLMTRQNKVYAA